MSSFGTNMPTHTETFSPLIYCVTDHAFSKPCTRYMLLLYFINATLLHLSPNFVVDLGSDLDFWETTGTGEMNARVSHSRRLIMPCKLGVEHCLAGG